MLFLGRIVAWLALIFGAARVGVGFFVAGVDDPAARAEAASNYLGSSTSGQAIDQGVKVFLFGLVLGLLVKIGRSAATRKN